MKRYLLVFLILVGCDYSESTPPKIVNVEIVHKTWPDSEDWDEPPQFALGEEYTLQIEVVEGTLIPILLWYEKFYLPDDVLDTPYEGPDYIDLPVVVAPPNPEYEFIDESNILYEFDLIMNGPVGDWTDVYQIEDVEGNESNKVAKDYVIY